jgi:hypothetical protein
VLIDSSTQGADTDYVDKFEIVIYCEFDVDDSVERGHCM